MSFNTCLLHVVRCAQQLSNAGRQKHSAHTVALGAACGGCEPQLTLLGTTSGTARRYHVFHRCLRQNFGDLTISLEFFSYLFLTFCHHPAHSEWLVPPRPSVEKKKHHRSRCIHMLHICIYIYTHTHFNSSDMHSETGNSLSIPNPCPPKVTSAP